MKEFVETILYKKHYSVKPHSSIYIYKEGNKYHTEVFRLHFSEIDYKIENCKTLQEITTEIYNICTVKTFIKNEEALNLLESARKKLENSKDKRDQHTVGFISEAIKWQREILK